MTELDELKRRFKELMPKECSSSHLAHWLAENGASAELAKAFRAEARREELWTPWDVGATRLELRTERLQLGYRGAARTIRTLTLRSTWKTLLFSLILVSALPFALALIVLRPADSLGQNLARLVSPAIIAVPAFLAGVPGLLRSIIPDRIELRHDRVSRIRFGKVVASCARDEIAYVEVATMFSLRAHAIADEPMWRRVGKLFFLRDHRISCAVFAMLRDGTRVMLADYLDPKLARATAARLEQELELLQAPQITARVAEQDLSEEADGEAEDQAHDEATDHAHEEAAESE